MSLQDKTKKELEVLAMAREIKFNSKTTKAELIELLSDDSTSELKKKADAKMSERKEVEEAMQSFPPVQPPAGLIPEDLAVIKWVFDQSFKNGMITANQAIQVGQTYTRLEMMIDQLTSSK